MTDIDIDEVFDIDEDKGKKRKVPPNQRWDKEKQAKAEKRREEEKKTEKARKQRNKKRNINWVKRFKERRKNLPGTSILRDPELLDKTVEAIQKHQFVIGDGKPIKITTLTASTIKCPDLYPTSTNMSFIEEGGAGKDYIVKATKELIFPHAWIHIQAPSDTAITHSDDIQEAENLEEVIIYVEDASNAFINSADFKMLTSSEHGEGGIRRTEKIDGEFKSKEIKLGEPAVIVTSANASASNELQRRLECSSVDTSQEKIEDVIDMENKKHSKKPSKRRSEKTKKLAREVMSAYNKLQKVIVIIPLEISKLVKEMYSNRKDVKHMTLHKRFLDMIKMSATIHQYQREMDGSDKAKDGRRYPVIVASKEDFENAKPLIECIEPRLKEGVIGLEPKAEKLYKLLKRKPHVTVNEIMEDKELNISHTTVRNYLKKLQRKGLVIKMGNNPAFYDIVEEGEVELDEI